MLACLPASTSHHPSRKALPAACRPPPPSPPPPHPPSLAAAEGESEPHLIGDAGEQGDRGFERATRKVYSLVSARDLGQLQRVRGGGVGPCGAQCCERGWGAEGVGGGGGGGRRGWGEGLSLWCGRGVYCTASVRVWLSGVLCPRRDRACRPPVRRPLLLCLLQVHVQQLPPVSAPDGGGGGGGGTGGWYLDRVDVAGPGGKNWSFPCAAWLGKNNHPSGLDGGWVGSVMVTVTCHGRG